MDVRLGDRLTLKKQHPCGGTDWDVLRVGADFRLRCVTCGRELMAPRSRIERSIRRLRRADGEEVPLK